MKRDKKNRLRLARLNSEGVDFGRSANLCVRITVETSSRPLFHAKLHNGFYAALIIISMMVSNFPAFAADKIAESDATAANVISAPSTLPAPLSASSNIKLVDPALAVSAIISPPILLTALTPAISSADKDIIAARAAFERRDLGALDSAHAALAKSGHPLVPYVDFWWLSVSFSSRVSPAASAVFAVAHAGEISAFLDANQDTPLAEPLRRNWLKALGTLDAWELFEPEFAKLNTDDSDVTCHQWRYLLTHKTQNDTEIRSQIKAAWLAGKNSGENCYAAFQLAFEADLIANENVWPRVRRALEANQPNDARRSSTFSKTAAQFASSFDRGLAAAAADPAKYLSAQKLDTKSPASVEVFLFAVTRLARTDAARAAALFAQHGIALNKADQAYGWAQIGQYGAMQHDTSALVWFRRADVSALDVAALKFALNDTQAGWKARAALRAGDWDTLSLAIDAMSVGERRDSAWRYWQARAYAQAGNIDAAKPIRAMLARENSFYGVLASEELGVPIAPNWQGYKSTRIELDRMLASPAIRRALALYRLDMKPEGVREWHYATRNLNDQDLLAAAEIARQAGIPDRAINAADRTSVVHDFTQRFPMPHRADMQNQARANQLDEAWMYGLIRQESRFMADARSSVGAMGLMQLMPATARWAASRVGMKNLALDRVNDVPINLNLGAYYLRHVLDDLGHPVLATAGYNAGPGRARRWRADAALEGAIYAETIPFTETRDYVKKVMANAWFYARQMGLAKVSLKDMMGNVPGRNRLDGSVGSKETALIPNTVSDAVSSTAVSSTAPATTTITTTRVN